MIRAHLMSQLLLSETSDRLTFPGGGSLSGGPGCILCSGRAAY